MVKPIGRVGKSSSEPELGGSRRKRKSQRAKRAKNPNTTTKSDVLTSLPPRALVDPLSLSGSRVDINNRPGSAGAQHAHQQAIIGSLMQQLAETKQQLSESQRATEQERVATTRGLADVASLATQKDELTAQVEELKAKIESKETDIKLLQADNSAWRAKFLRLKDEHACSMRCLQKFAVNNKLMGQMSSMSPEIISKVGEAAEAVLQDLQESKLEDEDTPSKAVVEELARQREGNTEGESPSLDESSGIFEQLMKQLDEEIRRRDL